MSTSVLMLDLWHSQNNSVKTLFNHGLALLIREDYLCPGSITVIEICDVNRHPKTDPIVRVEARRLRERLDSYGGGGTTKGT